MITVISLIFSRLCCFYIMDTLLYIHAAIAVCLVHSSLFILKMILGYILLLLVVLVVLRRATLRDCNYALLFFSDQDSKL
jgi:hypothetical protein